MWFTEPVRQGVFGLLALSSTTSATNSSCKCFPGDKCWPSTSTWESFNKTIDGNLVATVPLASPCHAPNYNAEECNALKENWVWPEEHYPSSSSVMAPFFTNDTCDPFHPISKPCQLGDFVRYAVNVSKPEHISKALRFVKKHNIRLVIRNTGHDYNGKSTGAGALAIWTHNLKDIEFKNHKDAHYTGKAAKLGAGVQGMEAYKAAKAQGLRMVGGECPTVGIAGGYSQGGGHSALNSRYGLAADQVLEWEVIDGQGNFLVANRQKNKDLFWALSGGGGGAYGVVWSMTSKAHTDGPVSALNLSIAIDGIPKDTFYKAIEFYHAQLPGIVDQGVMSLAFGTNQSFAIGPMTGPDIPVKKLEQMIQPFRNELHKLGINYTFYSQQFDTYLDEFDAMMPAITVSVAQYGSWLVPRSVVQKKNHDLHTGFRHITDNGGNFTTVAVNVSKKVAGDVHNAVLPAWRDAIFHAVLTTEWEFGKPELMYERQLQMTNDFVPLLSRLAPDSGAYLNEVDFRQPDFKKALYGANYNALRRVKAKYDPDDLFFGITAVGSDEWTVSNSGRMCKA